jgi:hypothetical protein
MTKLPDIHLRNLIPEDYEAVTGIKYRVPDQNIKSEPVENPGKKMILRKDYTCQRFITGNDQA